MTWIQVQTKVSYKQNHGGDKWMRGNSPKYHLTANSKTGKELSSPLKFQS